MDKSDAATVYEGIARVLQGRPGDARVVVIESRGGAAATGEAGAVSGGVSGAAAATAPRNADATGEDRVFRVKWNVQGHGVIAQVAYEDIIQNEHPDVYATLTELLANDPIGRDDMVKMAQWPDRIKPPSRGAEFKKWESLGQAHREDHYVNYAVDERAPTATPGAPVGKGVLLTELPNWCSQLKNEQDPLKRGHALAFVAHLIGDIHQPLHCAALFGKYFPEDEFPEGDQGGNLVWWGDTQALHSTWDGLVCKTADEFTDAVAALRNGLDRNAYAAQLSKPTFQEWSVESFVLAQSAYKKFFDDTEYLNRTQRTDRDGNDKDGQLFSAPSKKYRAWAKGAALDQGRIAAFRLADKLVELLG